MIIANVGVNIEPKSIYFDNYATNWLKIILAQYNQFDMKIMTYPKKNYITSSEAIQKILYINNIYKFESSIFVSIYESNVFNIILYPNPKSTLKRSIKIKTSTKN